MIESGITLKIEKNNYSEGALDFWIWNPETECYDPKNAFSDENRLLRFTSESRSLADYAEDELLPVLLRTYQRMKHIRVEYYGTLSDFSVLKKAAETQKENYACEIEFIPHCDMDPSQLQERMQREIYGVNGILFDREFNSAIQQLNKASIAAFKVQSIMSLSPNSDAKALIMQANYASVKMDTELERLTKVCVNTYSPAFVKNVSAILQHKIELEKYRKTLKQRMTNFAAKEMESWQDVDRTDVDDQILILKQKYPDKSQISADELKSFTKEIALEGYRVLTALVVRFTEKRFKETYANATRQAAQFIASRYGLCTTDIVFAPFEFDKNFESSIKEKLECLQNRYDSGEKASIWKGIERKTGVTEHGKKDARTFSISVSTYLKAYFTYSANRSRIDSVVKEVLDSLIETIVNEVQQALNNHIDDNAKRLRNAVTDMLTRLQIVISMIQKIEQHRNNLTNWIQNAENGAEHAEKIALQTEEKRKTAEKLETLSVILKETDQWLKGSRFMAKLPNLTEALLSVWDNLIAASAVVEVSDDCANLGICKLRKQDEKGTIDVYLYKTTYPVWLGRTNYLTDSATITGQSDAAKDEYHVYLENYDLNPKISLGDFLLIIQSKE